LLRSDGPVEHARRRLQPRGQRRERRVHEGPAEAEHEHVERQHVLTAGRDDTAREHRDDAAALLDRSARTDGDGDARRRSEGLHGSVRRGRRRRAVLDVLGHVSRSGV
jgi:hypothetical protein